MAMTVLITLTTAGSDTGPFDLYSDTDFFTVPFENNVPKASLVAGYVSVLVPDGTTIIRVESDGVCVNYIDLPLNISTTTTSSTTTASPGTILYVRTRDLGLAFNVTLYYSVNGGPGIALGTISNSECYDIGNISPLNAGDTVLFSTSTSCAMNGDSGSVCPPIAASVIYPYLVVGLPTEAVSITINSIIFP